jgi:hypothetical protein
MLFLPTLVERADVDGSIIVAYKVQSSDGEELEQFTLYAEMPKAGRSGWSAYSRVHVFNFAQDPQFVNHVKKQVEKCAKAVVQQLRSRMGESDLLRSFGVVFPQTFDNFDFDASTAMADTFANHFGSSKMVFEPLINQKDYKEEEDKFVQFACNPCNSQWWPTK